MMNKLIKHNKLIALFLVLAFVFSVVTPAWSNEADDDTAAEDGTEDATPTDEDEEVDVEPLSSRQCENPFACRDSGTVCAAGVECGNILKYMELVSSSAALELYVLKSYRYTGFDEKEIEIPVRDETGSVRAFDGSEPAELPLFDENGNPTTNVLGQNTVNRNAPPGGRGALSRPKQVNPADYEIESDEETVTVRYFWALLRTPVEKTMDAGLFAVRNKSNGFLWWSSPINVSLDPIAGRRPAQLSLLASAIAFDSIDPDPTEGARHDLYTNHYTSSGRTLVFNSFLDANNGIEIKPAGLPEGVRFNYHFPNQGTRISMEVSIDGDSVLVSIPHDKLIEENVAAGGSTMLTMSLLNSFGAGSENSGYIVVADGSGAVINFNNGKNDARVYSGKVYGRDFAVSQRRAAPVTQQVYLPVYGIVRNGGANALVAIAEKGAENATIRAAVAQQLPNNTSLNVAWFDFTMRTEDDFFIGTSNTANKIYESGHLRTGDISVRYYPLAAPVNASGRMIAGEELSYVDVALAYRSYLRDYMNVGANTSDGDAAFYMTVNGGTVKTHSIAGFPVELQTAATTYAQTQTMVDALRSGGVKNAVITYNDFNTAGIRRQVTTSVQYSNLLGGKSDWNRLSGAASQGGYSLYPVMDFMTFFRNGRGYNSLQHSAREATRSRAIQEQYELAFGTPDDFKDTWAILAPYYFERAMNNILRSLQSEGIKSVSLDHATSMIYSDFSRNNPFEYAETGFNRRDSVALLTQGFKALNDAGISIMASTAANAYALPYVSHITDVPLFSSAFDIFDYDVPFYQIAVSGLVPNTTRPFNASADLDRLVLLALSTGTPVHYEFIHESPSEFTDSDYSSLFYASYEGWIGRALELYHLFDEVIGGLANQAIVSHVRDPNRIINGELRTPDLPTETHIHETKFEDGTVIRVNFQTNEIFVNGREIDTMLTRRGG
ncbi:MAG: DUF5696 domain-containing protein [Oscillospiraceae bacterium]|nr:DUF5696 domain-containing protein [Oscillospiraceae bacterium]